MGFLNKNMNGMTPKERYTQLFNTARYNILILCALTVLNVILYLTGADSYFLFSAALPYHLVIIGAEAANSALLTIAIVFLIVSMGAYVACFILGKKHVGWMIAALVMFAIDTVYFIYIFFFAIASSSDSNAFSYIFDLAFHAYALYYFIAGVVYFFKMKNAPEAETETNAAFPAAAQDDVFTSGSDETESEQSGDEIDEIVAIEESEDDEDK